jgi:hypothetical protein
VIFTDEWGGGTRPRCRASDPPTWGANAVFDVVERKLRFASYYKLPAPQSEQENCVAHNGSLIPVPGRDIMVQAWYQGGVSVFDFTDSARPIEIAFFDRGPLDATQLIGGGHWSAYWYNGRIYATEIARGLDVLRLRPSEHLSQNEIDAISVVARAYLDQLTRSKAIDLQRAAALRDTLNRADELQTRRERNVKGIARELESLARQVDSDAGIATAPRDAARLHSLAAIVKGISARLR